MCAHFKLNMKKVIQPIRSNKPLEFLISDMRKFGRPICDENKKKASTFRWPTCQLMQNLKLLVPLQLKEIRTKGVPNYALTAIQLVFTNGMMTPFFDGQHSAADPEVQVVEITAPVKSIGGKFQADQTNVLWVKTGDEEKDTIKVFDKEALTGTVNNFDIPNDSSIVGVYGYIYGQSIRNLGFITAEFKADRSQFVTNNNKIDGTEN